MRRIGALVLTASLFVFVVGLSPHLVHHAFEHDQAAEDCAFAVTAERSPVAADTLPPLLEPLVHAGAPTVGTPIDPPRRVDVADAARAPPVPLS